MPGAGGRGRTAERLGQAPVSITLDTHSHTIPAMHEQAATVITWLVFATRQRRAETV